MSLNIHKNFKTGIRVIRVTTTKNPQNPNKESTVTTILWEGLRFIEKDDSKTSLEQFRGVYGLQFKDLYVIYCSNNDDVNPPSNISGTEKTIDYILFNQNFINQNTSFDPNLKDIVKLEVKDIDFAAGNVLKGKQVIALSFN